MIIDYVFINKLYKCAVCYLFIKKSRGTNLNKKYLISITYLEIWIYRLTTKGIEGVVRKHSYVKHYLEIEK